LPIFIKTVSYLAATCSQSSIVCEYSYLYALFYFFLLIHNHCFNQNCFTTQKNKLQVFGFVRSLYKCYALNRSQIAIYRKYVYTNTLRRSNYLIILKNLFGGTLIESDSQNKQAMLSLQVSNFNCISI
jgi:hypothetical protein